MDENKCPVCNGKPGPYRLGACSPGCDTVMGDDESIIGLLLTVLFVVAVLGVLAMVVLG